MIYMFDTGHAMRPPRPLLRLSLSINLN